MLELVFKVTKEAKLLPAQILQSIGSSNSTDWCFSMEEIGATIFKFTS
jgi:hypothetical protein